MNSRVGVLPQKNQKNGACYTESLSAANIHGLPLQPTAGEYARKDCLARRIKDSSCKMLIFEVIVTMKSPRVNDEPEVT